MATLSVSALAYDIEGEGEAARQDVGVLVMFSFDELCIVVVG